MIIFRDWLNAQGKNHLHSSLFTTVLQHRSTHIRDASDDAGYKISSRFRATVNIYKYQKYSRLALQE